MARGDTQPAGRGQGLGAFRQHQIERGNGDTNARPRPRPRRPPRGNRPHALRCRSDGGSARAGGAIARGGVMAEPTITLWRPVGLAEPALIRESGLRAFTPRRTVQPNFYPVTTEDSAIKIASAWKVRAHARGYVT